MSTRRPPSTVRWHTRRPSGLGAGTVEVASIGRIGADAATDLMVQTAGRDLWSWTVAFAATGDTIDEGTEPSREGARRSAIASARSILEGAG